MSNTVLVCSNKPSNLSVCHLSIEVALVGRNGAGKSVSCDRNSMKHDLSGNLTGTTL